MVVTQGDIFFVDFNPSIGHEQRNKRPAIALSHDLVAKFGGLKSTRVIKGKVMLDQTIALDLKARGVSNIEESIEKEELKEIIDKYKLLFDIV